LFVTLNPGKIGGHLSGDGFPNAEVIAVIPGVGRRLLHSFTTTASPLLGPYLKLPGRNLEPMGGF
jgi:hypothetical protein